MNDKSINNLSNSDLLKMVFVYNAVLNGWIFKKLIDNNFELIKKPVNDK